jgi:hypothetical protein
MNARTLLAPVLASLALAADAAEPLVPSFKPVDVDTNVAIGYGVAVADVDGDKKPDILLADKNLIVWYRNPAWTKHVMAERLTEKDHVCIAAADIDGDGKAEVAVGAEWNPGDTINSGAVFYLIPPADRTQKWEPVKLPHEPTVHRMRWVKNWQGETELVVVPLHGRGNKAATGEGDGVKILAYQKPSDPKQPWTTRLLNDALHKTHNFDPIQWDDDQGQELLVGGKEGAFVLNWVDDGLKLIPLAGNEGGGVGEIRLGKLPGGKRFFVTVEPMHGHALVCYTPPGASSDQKLWTRNVLDESLVDGHALACGDLAGVGSDQVVVGWRAMNRPGVKVGVKLFVPLDSDGQKWKQALIDDNTMACEDLALADFNSDGKLDLVAAGRATKNLKVYFNQGVK